MKTFKIKNATNKNTGRSQFHLINENNGKKELIQKDYRYMTFPCQAEAILLDRGYKVVERKSTKATTTLICEEV